MSDQEQPSDTVHKPRFYIEMLRESINLMSAGREKSLALTKLDECELWIQKSSQAAQRRLRTAAEHAATMLDPDMPFLSVAEGGYREAEVRALVAELRDAAKALVP